MGKKEEVGLKIRTMRKSRSMTQEDLAKAIRQSPSSITMYETGRRSPDYETLEALADVFNVPIASLVSDELVQDEATERVPVFIPDTQKFSRCTAYMTTDEYNTLMLIFKNVFKRMEEAEEKRNGQIHT